MRLFLTVYTILRIELTLQLVTMQLLMKCGKCILCERNLKIKIFKCNFKNSKHERNMVLSKKQ